MENNDNLNVTDNENVTGSANEAPETPKKKNKKAKKGNTALKIVAFLLVLSICYSAVQTVYIFKLNSGLEGVTSYLSKSVGSSDEDDDDDATEVDTTEADSDTLADPWFSLQEAASVTDPDKETLSTTEIVELVSPATLSIHVMQNSNQGSTEIAAGTGFIITTDGYIVTNQHVIEEAQEDPDNYYVTVNLPDVDDPVEAEIVGGDAQTDIAVLKVDYDGVLPCVTLGNSSTLQAGELVVAIGNALGTLDDTVTVGVVSALDREISNDGYTLTVIQTDAAINSGNSGGPLINSFGEVIGITNAKIVTSTSEGLGFAIPIDTVKEVIEDLINYGKVVNRPYLGMSVALVSEGSYYGVSEGVYVAAIVEDGPADEAGFELGDKILTIDGVEIDETGDIIDIRDSHDVGDVLSVVVVRDGERITLNLTIGDSGNYEDATYVDEDSDSSGSSDYDNNGGNGNSGNSDDDSKFPGFAEGDRDGSSDSDDESDENSVSDGSDSEDNEDSENSQGGLFEMPYGRGNK